MCKGFWIWCERKQQRTQPKSLWSSLWCKIHTQPSKRSFPPNRLTLAIHLTLNIHRLFTEIIYCETLRWCLVYKTMSIPCQPNRLPPHIDPIFFFFVFLLSFPLHLFKSHASVYLHIYVIGESVISRLYYSYQNIFQAGHQYWPIFTVNTHVFTSDSFNVDIYFCCGKKTNNFDEKKN